MKKRYLKCDYDEGLFTDEHTVKFNSSPQNWCFVNKADVILAGSKKGFVKCYLIAEIGEEAIVRINDVGDHRPSSFRVKALDLVARIA